MITKIWNDTPRPRTMTTTNGKSVHPARAVASERREGGAISVALGPQEGSSKRSSQCNLRSGNLITFEAT